MSRRDRRGLSSSRSNSSITSKFSPGGQSVSQSLFILRAATNSKKDVSRKRDRSASSAKLDKFEVPAAKMARATGSDRNVEAKFLEESFKKKEKR